MTFGFFRARILTHFRAAALGFEPKLPGSLAIVSDYPRISFGAKLRGAVRYRRSSARWLDAVTERQLP